MKCEREAKENKKEKLKKKKNDLLHYNGLQM